MVILHVVKVGGVPVAALVPSAGRWVRVEPFDVLRHVVPKSA